MDTKIACFYAGFGKGDVRRTAELTAKSAKQAMPDTELVLITDRFTPPVNGWDTTVRFNHDVDWDHLMLAKAQFVAQYAIQENCNIIFVDPDVYFNTDCRELFDSDWDVAFPFRRTAAHKCYNGALFFTKPSGQKFWEAYYDLAVRACPELHGWWVEQLTWAVMMGVDHDPEDELIVYGTKVKLLPHQYICPKQEYEPKMRMKTYTTHFANERKKWMQAYADL